MKAPKYPHSPIRSVDDLANLLAVSSSRLIDIAQRAENYYRANKPERKSSGGIRQTYTVLEPLLGIQEAIQVRILQHVVFPDYIFAVRNDAVQRDHISNANRHSGQAIVIREDIRDFFPSTTAKVVKNIWQGFFHFSDDVASLLTLLTTFKGHLPQGSCTSSYLASLVFWEQEPQLEFRLQQLGLVYTRYVDDITISSSQWYEMHKLAGIKSQLYGMLRHFGYRENRKKARNGISTSGFQQQVHRLNVSSGRVTLPKDERKKIRAEVHRFVNSNPDSLSSSELQRRFHHIAGRVAYLRQLHPKQAENLQKDLDTFMSSNLSSH